MGASDKILHFLKALRDLDESTILNIYNSLDAEGKDMVCSKYLLLSELLLTEEIDSYDLDLIKGFSCKDTSEKRIGEILQYCLKKENFAPEEYGEGLTRTQVQALTETLPLLPSLERLDLHIGEEVDLSKLFKELEQIQVLKIESLVPLKIDESIGKLKKLEILTVKGCDVSLLLQNLGELESLDYLYLSDNDLKHFPANSKGHSVLTLLDLSGNPLASFPQSLKFPHLRTLNLNNCKLDGPLPNVSETMPRLISLEFSHNQLSDISLLAKSQNLEHVALEGNPIHEFPQKLSTLRTLHISSFQLDGLVRALGDDHGLKRLSIMGTKDPIDFGLLESLSHLESLHIQNAVLHHSAAIKNLRSLKSLSLLQCEIDVLPDELWLLDQLEDLNLAQNRLVELPNQFERLDKLKSLHLSGNRLETLPESLLRNKRISILYLGDNNISKEHFRELAERTTIKLKY